jgi:predicted nucleic acid-binding protein
MQLTTGNKYLFDTGIFIKARRRKDPLHARARWLLWQARDQQISVGYSVMTEAELWVGISAAQFRTEAEHKILLRPYRRYLLNAAIARRGGEMRRQLNERGVGQNDGPQLVDCLILATAEFHRLIVYTTDVHHFSKINQYAISAVQIAYL